MEQLLEDYKIFKQQKEWLNKKPWLLKKECEMCKGKTDLDVYHKYYYPGKLPWEYTNNAYITLCAQCEKDRPQPILKTARKKEPKKYLNVLEEFRLKQIEEWLNRKINREEW